MLELNKIYCGDSLEVLKTFPDESINCCVTSPPYWGLRDYNVKEQLGLEKTPEEYVENMVKVFREVKRVLKDDGTLWLNLGDSYNGSGKAGNKNNTYFKKHTEFGKPATHKDKIGNPTNVKTLKSKDLIGIPWMVAFALRADGWYLRQDIIWHKPNPMPESVTDRCTKAHEYIFLLSKSSKYYYDYKAISEKSKWFEKDHRSADGYTVSDRMEGSQYQCQRQGVYNEDGLANKRSVWKINTKAYREAHFATFPEKLIWDCVKAGCPENGIVLDPFMGAGTTGLVARKLDRNYVGIELNPKYIEIANKRIKKYTSRGIPFFRDSEIKEL